MDSETRGRQGQFVSTQVNSRYAAIHPGAPVFGHMMDDHVTLVKQTGQRVENIPSLVQPDKIFIEDATIPIEEGDHFERELPNGLVERYLVLDRGFYKGMGRISDHYQTSVRKETAIRATTRSGPTVYNVTGPNARININSTDLSANVVNVSPENLFAELRKAVTSAFQDETRQTAVLTLVADMESAKGGKSFLVKYREFVAAAADHMTVLSPFIPALTQLLK